MEPESLLHRTYQEEEDNFENSLRPKRLADFLGQKQLKENLSIFIEAAKKRGEGLDHVFISGPPGLGKTTLAGIMAQELTVDIKVTSAPAIEKAKDLAGFLTTISENSIFFIDEIHRLKPPIEEMLYIAMEDYELDWVIGQGPSARTIRIPLPKFTLVGATTKAGHVAGPLVSRFGIPLKLSFYNDEDIREILFRTADILKVDIKKEAATILSKCSRGTPRVANRLLRRIRDFAEVLGEGKITREIVDDGLKRLRIDEYGLEQHDRQILSLIIEHYQGGPVGAETLAISMGETLDTLEDYYEPYLIQKGFLKRTPRGRMVTELSYKHLGKRKQNNENQGFLL